LKVTYVTVNVLNNADGNVDNTDFFTKGKTISNTFILKQPNKQN